MNPLFRLYLRLRYGAPTAENPIPYAAHFTQELADTVRTASQDTESLRLMHSARMNELADQLLSNAITVSEEVRNTQLRLG